MVSSTNPRKLYVDATVSINRPKSDDVDKSFSFKVPNEDHLFFTVCKKKLELNL